MDIIKFYNDYDIAYADEDYGNKHCRPGWIQIDCPFCLGTPNFHLGYNYVDDYFRCWRCGWHPKEKVISKLIICNEHQAKEIIKQYKGRIDRPSKTEEKKIIGSIPFSLPSMLSEFSEYHLEYLWDRRFDPLKLIVEYDLKATRQVSFLGGADYKWRIIIPIHYGGQIVSFQSRAIVDKDPKYKACPMQYESIHHRNLLYGIDKAKSDSVIVVEGVFDAWRIGTGAVATFGVEYSFSQVKMLSQFKKVFVLYDSDPAGESKGQELVSMLRLKTRAERIHLPYGKDPADLKQEDADALKKSLV